MTRNEWFKVKNIEQYLLLSIFFSPLSTYRTINNYINNNLITVEIMKSMKYLTMLMLLFLSAALMGCSKDEDPDEIISTSIVGEWYMEDDTQSITYKFNSNLRGTYLEVNYDAYGEETTRISENFEYSLSESSSGMKTVVLVFETQSFRFNYDVTATKLLLYQNNGESYLEFKKR